MTLRPFALVLALALGSPSIARAASYDVTASDDLIARLRSLAPGDEVVVHDGTWDTGGLFSIAWNGTATMPIVVRAADGAHPVIRGVSTQNVIDLDGAYFTFRGFELTAGSHGLRLGNVDHATIADLVIHDVGDVGLSCNRPGDACTYVTIDHVEIYGTGIDGGTGEGMYLGCNDAGCRFEHNVVRRSYIHDLRTGSQGDGIEIKTGAFDNLVEDNVIVRSGYPGITMYGFDATSGGAPNVVHRNLIWHTLDNGIQIVGQIVVTDNIVIDAAAAGIASKSSQGFSPDGAVIENNTVILSPRCFGADGWDVTSGQVLANNALYCDGQVAIHLATAAPAAFFGGNVVMGDVQGLASGFTTGAASDFANLGAFDLYPSSGGALVDAGDVAHAAADDFDGTARSDGHPDVGAYERSAAGRGWMLTEGFHDGTMPTMVTDAGATIDASTGLDAGGTGLDASTSHADAGAMPSANGGCGCHAGSSARPPFFLLVALALVVGARRRR